MEIKVSICCTAYNHEEYIARALESFVMQETDFDYEILIHDDASTDRTCEIVSEYEKSYPEIITLVRQRENKYSRGIPIEETYLLPKAKGKYIAVCEGDDYWTDSQKLQKQFDFMESHPNCSLCMHGAIKVRASDEKEIDYFKALPSSRFLSTEEIIEKENAFSTNSMFYLKEHLNRVPKFFFTAPIGDYPLTIWFSLKGDVYYMEDVMSAYRILAKGSWTSRLIETPGALQEHNEKLEKWLLKLDAYTDKKYTETISRHILENRFRLSKSLYDLQGAKIPDYSYLYRTMSLKDKVKLHIGHYLPFTLKMSKFLRHRLLENND